MKLEAPEVLGRIGIPWFRKGSSLVNLVGSVQRVIPGAAARIDIQNEEREALKRLWGDLEFIRDNYGIRVRVGRRVGADLEDTRFDQYSTPSIVAEDISFFRTILGKYPPDFIRNCAITQARMVKKLELEDYVYWEGHRRIGGLASSEGPIYVSGFFPEGTIHHEIFHRADQQSGQMTERKQRRWMRLNPSGSPYLHKKYWDMTFDERVQVNFRGFGAIYGRCNIWEDRAVIAELLMKFGSGLFTRTDHDEVLAEKVRRIMIDLGRWSGERMNEQYFRDLETGVVNEDYWK